MKLRFECALLVSFLVAWAPIASARLGNVQTPRRAQSSNGNGAKVDPPNVLVFIVDDMGWNQVGYHASKVNNTEIQTPKIDSYVQEGIELNRGYMTPWCAPSRAAIQTGRSNVFNANVSNDVFAFDEDIGFVGGLLPETPTLANAFAAFGEEDASKPYKSYFNGKWGIGGTAWTNTPYGMGYDEVRAFWGDSIDSCTGRVPIYSVPPASSSGHFQFNSTDVVGGSLLSNLPGYFDQSNSLPDADWCEYIQSLDSSLLTNDEKQVACKTIPRDPPKLIDEDLLDTVTSQIRNHDYNSTAMLQVFATQAMHLPMNFPQRFADEAVAAGELPEYFLSGNENLRNSTNMAARWVDYLFDETMQALKDAGQWDNTIVYFTSDNGGAIYTSSANNNYPHRAAKFSSFEGGVRVNQFMTGGWFEKNNVPTGKSTDTYIFPMDIGVTLLDMAGGKRSYLLDDSTDGNSMYGHSVWKEIQDSVQKDSYEQKVRKVSYSADFFFDVQENKTMKFFWTEDNAVLAPRHWAPVWPTNDDLVMDTGYVSVHPCRFENGTTMDCCQLDITNDPREFDPLYNATCNDMRLEAQTLYDIPCSPNSTSPMCLTPGHSNISLHNPSNYSFWSTMGAAGPFTNSKGVPIPGMTLQGQTDDNPMKCVCDAIAEGVSPADVDYYTLNIMSPTVCRSSVKDKGMLENGVKCNGQLVFNPQGPAVSNYVTNGYDKEAFTIVMEAEQRKDLVESLEYLYKNFHSYVTREKFTEWPSLTRMPYHGLGLDQCVAKGASTVPVPFLNFAPYSFGLKDPTKPQDQSSNLCMHFTDLVAFCPSVDNANLQAVKSWEIDFGSPINSYAVLEDGTHMTAIDAWQCNAYCPSNGQGSMYVGNSTDTWGIKVAPFQLNETLLDSLTEAPSDASITPMPTFAPVTPMPTPAP